MLKSIWRGAVIAGLTIGLAACIPEFANPIVGGNKADPDIIGNWLAKGSGDEEKMPIAITAEGDGVVVVMQEEGGGGKAPDSTSPSSNELRFAGTTAEVDGMRYVNLKPVGNDVPADSGSMIMRYEMKDGAIHVVSLDNAKVKAAVEAGQLKGAASGAGTDSAVKVSATSEEIAAFFATDAGKAAFDTSEESVLVLTRATP